MQKTVKLFKEEIKIINIGLSSFYTDLKKQKAKVVDVDWRPRAGGSKKISSLLDRLKTK